MAESAPAEEAVDEEPAPTEPEYAVAQANDGPVIGRGDQSVPQKPPR
ncbi:hypothetical protein GCM10022202_17610 [Microbacterium marinilacus]|uniref:Uncharacterized protein n=1 Tax=Microbacterium marinilacus TaxID=415209 RepID=A0ABP7BFP5_9MICO